MDTKSKIGKSVLMAAAIAYCTAISASTLGCLEDPHVEGTFDTLSCTVSEANYWQSVQNSISFISVVHTAEELDGFRANSDPAALFCTHNNTESHDIVTYFCNRTDGDLNKGRCKLENPIAKCKDLSSGQRYVINSANNLEAHRVECEADRDIWTEL